MPEVIKPKIPKIFVALDYPLETQALDLVEKLKDYPLAYKVGMELGIASRFSIIEKLKQQGKEVFLDFKFFDIPQTVKNAVQSVCDLGVDYFTVHLSGGEKMIREANAVLNEERATSPMLLGVSVLTSFSEEVFRETIAGKPNVKISDQVDFLVQKGVQWGVRGIVCSSLEVQAISQKFPDLFKVVPGIRPQGAPQGDQARVMTPEQAHAAGASALVIGRPITAAEDPSKIVESILKSFG